MDAISQWVSYDDIISARRANLYDFLLRRHYNDIKKEGNSLRLRNNNSVSIKVGYSGFTDFSTGEKGNAVNCLINYLGYDFQEAVAALCADIGMNATGQPERLAASKTPHTPQKEPEMRTFSPPKPLQGQYRQLHAYLTQQRGIPPAMVQRLIEDKLLYQEDSHANMVFIDPTRSFAELRGSNSFKPFHQVMFSDPAAFWWYKPCGLETNPVTAYVCESAIDAVSLYLLMSLAPSLHAEQGLYCSIGGVANQQRINAIKASMTAAGGKTIIAVDNDQAGELCRQRNPDCQQIIPAGKDWNEDLISWEGHTAGAVGLLEKNMAEHRNRG